MTLKRLRRPLPGAALRMTVRAEPSWRLRAALWLAVLAAAGALAFWTYRFGARNAGFDQSSVQEQIGRLESELTDLRAERESLSTAVNAANSNLSIEKAAHDKLIGEVRSLETENAKLKQDLAFFDRILPSNSGQGVAVRSFQVEREDLGETQRLRYRLLVSQDAKATKDFVGQIQFVLTLVQEGRGATVTIPAQGDGTDRAYMLSFRMFQRLEGVIDVPPGAQARSVQVKVMENGSVRAQQSAAVGAG